MYSKLIKELEELGYPKLASYLSDLDEEIDLMDEIDDLDEEISDKIELRDSIESELSEIICVLNNNG